jgi:hypothetical protein
MFEIPGKIRRIDFLIFRLIFFVRHWDFALQGHQLKRVV